MLSIRLVPLLIWAGAIFAFSSISNPPGPSGVDRTAYVAHGFEYGLLAFLAVRWARRAFPSAPLASLLVLTWLGCVAYGASDEFHQSFVSGRDASYGDWVADATGAALGLIGWRVFLKAGERVHPA